MGTATWGEWHSYPFEGQYATAPGGQTDITLASSLRIIRAVTTAFPNKFVLLNSTGSRVSNAQGVRVAQASHEWSNLLWRDALALSPRLGLRNDCLGGGATQKHALDGLLEASRFAQANGTRDPLERWRTAPFASEYCAATSPTSVAPNGGTFEQGLAQVEAAHVSWLSSDNYTGAFSAYSAAEQEYLRRSVRRSGYRYQFDRVKAVVSDAQTLTLTTTWRNVNVAPTYRKWTVVYDIRAEGWPSAATVTSSVDLTKVLPGAPVTVTDSINVASLWAGQYQVSVRIVDADGVLAPMRLGIATARQSDGRYILGEVTLT